VDSSPSEAQTINNSHILSLRAPQSQEAFLNHQACAVVSRAQWRRPWTTDAGD